MALRFLSGSAQSAHLEPVNISSYVWPSYVWYFVASSGVGVLIPTSSSEGLQRTKSMEIRTPVVTPILQQVQVKKVLVTILYCETLLYCWVIPPKWRLKSGVVSVHPPVNICFFFLSPLILGSLFWNITVWYHTVVRTIVPSVRLSPEVDDLIKPDSMSVLLHFFLRSWWILVYG